MRSSVECHTRNLYSTGASKVEMVHGYSPFLVLELCPWIAFYAELSSGEVQVYCIARKLYDSENLFHKSSLSVPNVLCHYTLQGSFYNTQRLSSTAIVTLRKSRFIVTSTPP